jgi:polyisoprenoid-binding protein YceI
MNSRREIIFKPAEKNFSKELRMKKLILAIVVLTLASLSAAAATVDWQIDSVHSGVYFVVRHIGIINQHGSFNKCSGTVQIDDQDISKSKVVANVDISSISTGVEMRDKHLLSPDFFDVAKYPTMTFESTKISKAANGDTKMTGNLTIHGVTKEVTFDLVGPTAPVNKVGALRRGISATTKIDRRDFGITFDDTVGNEVSIDLEMDVMRKDPAKEAGKEGN